MRGGPNWRDDMHHVAIAAAPTGLFRFWNSTAVPQWGDVSVQVHPAIDGTCKTCRDKRTKCLVFSFCGVENGNGELRYFQQILTPERINLPAGIQDTSQRVFCCCFFRFSLWLTVVRAESPGRLTKPAHRETNDDVKTFLLGVQPVGYSYMCLFWLQPAGFEMKEQLWWL